MDFVKVVIISLILTLFPDQCKCFFRSGYNKMMNKAKDYYKSKFKKDQTWHFLGYDLSEYPGTNEQYRDINKQKWNEYYSCLQIQNESIGLHGSVIPEAMLRFEGASIRFDCKICLNPRERDRIDSVEWLWAPLNNQHLTEVEYTEHILLTPEDKTLTLYNLREDQTGQYMCKLGNTLTAPYFLTVVNSNTNATEVHTKFASNGPYPRKPISIENHNLVIDTEWDDWSLCSTCDTVGKRFKFGYCIIVMKERINREVANATTVATTEQEVISTTTSNSIWGQIIKNIKSKHHLKHTTPNLTEEPEENVRDDLEILKIFKNGIPCFSHILPSFIKTLIKPMNVTNEIMTGYCKVPCEKNSIFEVKDKDGNVLERANNSAGIYSMMQGIPPVQPPVDRMLQYVVMGENIVISCPGNLNTDTPVQWQMGSKKLIPEVIAQQSNRRIYISVLDKINIKKSKISDSNVYSCWQNNELAGTVRLVVEKKIKLKFNHHIMLLGMIIILSVFLYVIVRAFYGRKYALITK